MQIRKILRPIAIPFAFASAIGIYGCEESYRLERAFKGQIGNVHVELERETRGTFWPKRTDYLIVKRGQNVILYTDESSDSKVDRAEIFNHEAYEKSGGCSCVLKHFDGEEPRLKPTGTIPLPQAQKDFAEYMSKIRIKS